MIKKRVFCGIVAFVIAMCNFTSAYVPEEATLVGAFEIEVASFPGGRGWAEVDLGNPASGMVLSYGAVDGESSMTDSDFVAGDCVPSAKVGHGQARS